MTRSSFIPNSPAEPLPAPGSPGARAGRWAPWWVMAFVALWPLPGIAETVLVLGALYAAVRMVQLRLQGKQRLLSSPAWALTSILFLGYWLPQAFSAFDAIDPSEAWRKTAAGLRYLPFMWLVAIAVATPQRRSLTLGGIALIAGVWTLDALAQAAFGSSPLFWSLDQLKWAVSGHGLCTAAEAAAADRLSGVLGPCNLKFGQVLASLSPFLLFAAAHLHSSIPNQTGETRFSIDFRVVNRKDLRAREGAPNVDSRCTGSPINDYLQGTTLEHLPPDIQKMYLEPATA